MLKKVPDRPFQLWICLRNNLTGAMYRLSPIADEFDLEALLPSPTRGFIPIEFTRAKAHRKRNEKYRARKRKAKVNQLKALTHSKKRARK